MVAQYRGVRRGFVCGLGADERVEIYDLLVAKTEAVLEHRKAPVEPQTLALAYAREQLLKLPTEIRDHLPTTGKVEPRLRQPQALGSAPV